MGEGAKGVAGLVGACVIWGLSPLFYKLLDHVPATEVLAHRTLWSLAIFGALLSLQSRLQDVVALLRTRRTLALVAVATLMISVNWFTFIWAVQNERTVEAALGYYIFPLAAVLLGVIVLRERLTGFAAVAVTLAATGVLVLTIGLGEAPWVSLLLGVTFGLYGLVKKSLEAGPVVSVTAEVLLFAPVAVAWLVFAQDAGADEATGRDARDTLLLVLSGPMTAAPLVLFSYGARRVRLATVGLVQYLNPSLQFLVAGLILAEAVTVWHGIALPLIWAGLAIYSAAAWRQEKSARRAAITVSTSLGASKKPASELSAKPRSMT